MQRPGCSDWKEKSPSPHCKDRTTISRPLSASSQSPWCQFCRTICQCHKDSCMAMVPWWSARTACATPLQTVRAWMWRGSSLSSPHIKVRVASLVSAWDLSGFLLACVCVCVCLLEIFTQMCVCLLEIFTQMAKKIICRRKSLSYVDATYCSIATVQVCKAF